MVLNHRQNPAVNKSTTLAQFATLPKASSNHRLENMRRIVYGEASKDTANTSNMEGATSLLLGDDSIMINTNGKVAKNSGFSSSSIRESDHIHQGLLEITSEEIISEESQGQGS